MAVIYIDGRKHEIRMNGSNLLEVCLSLGYDLPYFCWHPALGSVGACRQCAVKKFKDEADQAGKIVMACMEPVTDGLRLSISDPEVREFRANIISWLMINHPHDCPVCDEGGECHLQDMTVMSGHTYRNFRFKKQSFRNQNLGPFINHEMNRCIQCFRCVRFYRDYAGGKDLNAFASRDRTYFGRHEEGTLESEFSGNLVEVCPTGVFTDKTLKKHYTRKWDLQNAPSLCVHCSLGCNIIAGERSGSLRRVVNRYNSQINGYFLCDRGRFGYEFVNNPDRIIHPMYRKQREEAFECIDPGNLPEFFDNTLKTSGKILGIGSSRASLESNYALRRLVGHGRFYHDVSSSQFELHRKVLDIMTRGPNKIVSLSACASADAVLILGVDPTNCAPMIDLALRQAVRQKPLKEAQESKFSLWNDAAVRELMQDRKGPLFLSTPSQTKLDGIARAIHRSAPEDSALFGFAIAHNITNDAPAPEIELPPEVKTLAHDAAQELLAADNPLIITGSTGGEASLLEAAANIGRALNHKNKDAGLCFIFSECNSLGLTMMSDRSLDEAYKVIDEESVETVIVMESDLYRHMEHSMVDNFIKKVKQLIVLDSIMTPTAMKADILLPSGTFAESDGTLVNNEGRAQRFFKAHPPRENSRESRHWLAALTGEEKLENYPEFIDKLIEDLPQFKEIKKLAPSPGVKIPRQSFRFSGRTALTANINVSEAKPPEDPDSPLIFSMEAQHSDYQASYLPLIWAPGWNSAQAINKYQSGIGGPLRGGDPGIRLIIPSASDKGYFAPDKNRNERIPGFRINTRFHIYGSDELSNYAAAVATRIPQGYIAMNPSDARQLGIIEGSEVELQCGKTAVRFPAKIDDTLPAGNIGYPVGLPGIPYLEIPGHGTITKVGQ